LTDFKRGEYQPSVERNMSPMFKIIRLNRTEIEMWHIYFLSVQWNKYPKTSSNRQSNALF